MIQMALQHCTRNKTGLTKMCHLH